MSIAKQADVIVTQDLLEAIVSLPTQREVQHCGETFAVFPFAIYAECPACKARFKVRSFAAAPEIEDVFDAVFTWMNQPGAAEIAQQRQQEIAVDSE